MVLASSLMAAGSTFASFICHPDPARLRSEFVSELANPALFVIPSREESEFTLSALRA